MIIIKMIIQNITNDGSSKSTFSGLQLCCTIFFIMIIQ